MTTPSVMNSLLCRLREKRDEANEQKHEVENRPNTEFGVGYAHGYYDALNDFLDELV
jgi:hypothetical protein